jgi:anthranilate/para-aminobenzoate synthase component II
MNFFDTFRKLKESDHDLEDDAIASKHTKDAHAFSGMNDHGNAALHHSYAAGAHEAAAKMTYDKSVQQYHGLMAAHHKTMKSYHEAQ